MTTHRVLFFGSAGQLGQALQQLAAQGGVPKEWELIHSARATCDITNPAALRDTIQQAKPDLLINAASLSGVDEAESNPLAADAVNFHAVAQMASQCGVLDVPMIHLSSDYVFDGRQNSPYTPDDLMNPLNKYGASKLMGEEAVRYEFPFHVILRVSSVFSAYRRNILTAFLKKLNEQEEVRVAEDLIAAPTPAQEVAKALVVIGSAILDGKKDGFGTFHFCGAPPCSRLAFAQAVVEGAAALSDKKLARLIGVKSEEAALAAPRPRYSVLDCAKTKAIYGIEQPDWRPALTAALASLNSGARVRL